MSSEVGVAGLHAIAERVGAEDAVCVPKRHDRSRAEAEVVVTGLHDLAKGWVSIGHAGYSGHVAGSGILALGGEAIRVFKVGICSSKAADSLGHFIGKGTDAACIVACERAGNIVTALYQKGVEELDA